MTRTAVVVGAGLAGLATAGALARAGWRVTLLERAERIAAEATGLVLWPNGVRALHALQPDAAWAGVTVPLPDGGVRRPDGQWLVHPRPRAAGAPAAVHQQDLVDSLLAGLGDVDVCTGVAVDEVRVGPDRRPAVLGPSGQWEADLLVAADGIDSVVRRHVAPEAGTVASGFAAWQAVVPGYRLPRLTDFHAGVETLGVGYRFVAAPLAEHSTGRGGVCWTATAAGAARPEPADTQLTLLRRWFGGWHDPIGELLAATRPEDIRHREVRELRPLPRAYGFLSGPGGVVLVGDAAHAMPHHLGQGACLAFEDAATLGAMVAEAEPGAPLSAAVQAYSRQRRPRTAGIVRQTRRMSAAVQARGRLALRARDVALGALTPRLLGRPSTTWTPPTP